MVLLVMSILDSHDSNMEIPWTYIILHKYIIQPCIHIFSNVILDSSSLIADISQLLLWT